MGGGSYEPSLRRRSTGYSAAKSHKKDHLPKAQVSHLRKKGDSKNRPKNRGTITTDSKNPVIVAFDDTGSMGDWVDEFYKRAPMFYGQIRIHNYLEDPTICLAVIGDTYSDDEPLQVTDFCRGDALDQALESLFIERGGGGTFKESYQLAAYYFTKKCDIPENIEIKPFFFFFGDEAFYESVTMDEAKYIFDDSVQADARSDHLFKELMKKYDCYILRKTYPSKSSEEIIDYAWKEVLSRERVVMLNEGNQVVDTMLGIIAMRKGTSLGEYLKTLKERKQTDKRIADVRESLMTLCKTIFKSTNPDDLVPLPGESKSQNRVDEEGTEETNADDTSGPTTIINVSGDVITGGKLVKGSEIADSVITRSSVEASDSEESKKKKKKGKDDKKTKE